MSPGEKCPLCGNSELQRIQPADDRRRYLLCGQCRLIFAEPRFLLAPAEEKARYDRHENGPDRPGYVAFLEQLLKPALRYLRPGMHGLDFGCGPNPVVAGWLRDRGIACDNYDPFYGFRPEADAYDFVISTEAVEHFRDPVSGWQNMTALLKPGGLLLIMTERWDTLERFAAWHYKTDATHICFYHLSTFAYVCGQWGLRVEEHDDKRIIIMRETGDGTWP